MLERLKSFNGKAKEAFSDLDKNPIWLWEAVAGDDSQTVKTMQGAFDATTHKTKLFHYLTMLEFYHI